MMLNNQIQPFVCLHKKRLNKASGLNDNFCASWDKCLPLNHFSLPNKSGQEIMDWHWSTVENFMAEHYHPVENENHYGKWLFLHTHTKALNFERVFLFQDASSCLCPYFDISVGSNPCIWIAALWEKLMYCEMIHCVSSSVFPFWSKSSWLAWCRPFQIRSMGKVWDEKRLCDLCGMPTSKCDDDQYRGIWHYVEVWRNLPVIYFIWSKMILRPQNEKYHSIS